MAEIELQDNITNHKKYNELNCGDVFIKDGKVYMATDDYYYLDGCPNRMKFVELSTGEIGFFAYDADVILTSNKITVWR